MPKMYVMVGVPGSGKSTWTRENIETLDGEFVIASSDDMAERIAKEKGISYNDAIMQSGKTLEKYFKGVIRDAVEDGKDLIIDRTNMTINARRKVMGMAPGYEFIAVVFSVPDDELEARLARREAETGKFIPPHVVKMFKTIYVEPTADEGFSEIIFVEA